MTLQPVLGLPTSSSVDDRQQFQRTAALARMSALLAAHDSLDTVLTAMAHEIQQVDAIAGAQIILVEGDGSMKLMGSAAFGEYDDFFDRLMACHRNGAPLATYAALGSGQQRVYRDRKTEMLTDDRWEPLHSYISEIEWAHFIATPFSLQGRTRGVVNCYIAADATITPPLEWFLDAIAEQAALAVDYHGLMERDRSHVRRDERERIARDLHDSVIQNLFSIAMHARALEGRTSRSTDPSLGDLARDIQALTAVAQRDLRGVVRAVRPSVVADLGLERALRALAADASRRFEVETRQDLVLAAPVDPELADDAYLLVAEALHNAMKHAHPTIVDLVVRARVEGQLDLTVRDDGIGIPPDGHLLGYGIASMRHRAERWGGRLEVLPAAPHGTTVRTRLFSVNVAVGGRLA